MAGRGSESKLPIVAAVPLSEAGYPIRAKFTPALSFRSGTNGASASQNLAPSFAVLSNSLACFRFVTIAGCTHGVIVSGGKHLNDLQQFRWINALLGNLKTSLRCTYHAFDSDKYARRYLGGYGSCPQCQQRSPLGLTRPPGGPTDDHATAL
jgi:hypothetical protein